MYLLIVNAELYDSGLGLQNRYHNRKETKFFIEKKITKRNETNKITMKKNNETIVSER